MRGGYYALIACWLVIGWSGCGMLRQTVKTVDASRQDSTVKTQVKVKDEQETVKQTWSLTTGKDSAGAIYHLSVWPKGRFTFSAEKGFEGEADSVQLSGENWAFENHSEILRTEEQQKTQSAMEGKQELKTKSVQENSIVKNFADYKLIIGAIIFFFLLFFLFFRK